MKTITVAITKKTAAWVLTGSLLFTTGCATTHGGGTGNSMQGFGGFVSSIGQAIRGDAGKTVRSLGGTIRSTGATIARQEQQEMRRLEAKRRQKEAEERRRQIVEQRRLKVEQERQALAAMTPEQRAQYEETKQRDQRDRNRMLLKLLEWGASAAQSSGSTGVGGGNEEYYYRQTTPSAPSYGGGYSAPAINSFYGSCHNPMGC